MKALGIVFLILLIAGGLYVALTGAPEEFVPARIDTSGRSRIVPADTAASPETENTVVDIETAPVTVRITADGFSPATLTIPAGTMVVWTNNDSAIHYVAPDVHTAHRKYRGIWDDVGAGRIASAETYAFIFSEPGIYTYHDHLFPSLTGTIIVQ